MQSWRGICVYIPLYKYMYSETSQVLYSFKHLVYNVHLNCMAILPPSVNLKDQWRTHNSRCLVPVFSQLNKCHVLTSYLFVSITLKLFILQILINNFIQCK